MGMKALSHYWFRLLLLCCSLLTPAGAAQAADLLEAEQAFRFSARMKDAQTIEVRYDIARGYYMYRDNFRFAVEGAQLGAPKIPPGKKKFDSNFQKTMETHRDSVVILLPVQGASGPLQLKSTSQGCADAGVCYPPTTQSATLSLNAEKPQSSPAPKPAGGSPFVKPTGASGFTRIASSSELDGSLQGAGRITMLDFYADWCGPCKQMERLTFSDARVKQKMASLVLLQADVTRNNEDDRVLLKRFKLVGPPGILFFDRNGREITALRVIGYQAPEKFLQTLEQAARS